MAVVMQMHWPEVTKEEYEAVRSDVNWEGNVPDGAKFHVAWWAKDGFRVIDLWDSGEQFQKFVDTRLMPSVQKAGIHGQPNIEVSEAHAIFAPNV
ncbi:MAG TPA: hypothetical protein VMU84_01010 [Thermoanaerobaculia bacterium]|nr:hypothetical protein [Thermoanaerobaculia bacterium]